jgi:hypothetical protein
MYVPSSDSPLGAVFDVDHLHQFPQKLPYLERNIEQQNLAAWGAKATACVGDVNVFMGHAQSSQLY